MKGAISKATELVGTTANSFMPQQFENPANPAIHEATTGPEIEHDLDGQVDIFVAGVGTGGTITGTSRYFKSQGKPVTSYAVEPVDSPVIQQTIDGDEIKPGPHKIQGIGAGFVPRNLDLELVTGVIHIDNDEAMEMSRQVAKLEGIFGGISTGANIAAACKVAEMPEHAGKNIVTIGCSFGERYLSTPMFQQYMN